MAEPTQGVTPQGQAAYERAKRAKPARDLIDLGKVLVRAHATVAAPACDARRAGRRV
jgi:hypothetical protein